MPVVPQYLDPVGVIGLGLLGRGIVASLLGAGFRVIAFDIDPQVCVDAQPAIAIAIAQMVHHGATTAEIAHSWQERYTVCSALDGFKPCRFVIETIFENLSLKSKVYDELECIVASDTPIASNTSALPITNLQVQRKNPERILGMHWADPAYATRFLEIVRGEHTSDETVSAAMELANVLGKQPSLVLRDLPGFIVNRLGYAMYREAAFLLESGVANAETIDDAVSNTLGLWSTFCGPFRWIDITGGPALYAEVMRTIVPTLNNNSEVPAIFAQKKQDNERGTGNGQGFYTYEPGDAERWRNRYHERVWELWHLQQPGSQDK